MHEAHDINPVFSPDGKYARLQLQPPRQLRRVRRPGGRRQADAAHLRLRPRHGHRLVARRQERPVLLDRARPRSRRTPSCTSSRSRAARSGSCRCSRAKEAYFAPTGDMIAFVRGPGTWYRKGYRGSSNDDIWLCNADGTDTAAADRRSTARTTRRCGQPGRRGSSTTSARTAASRLANIVCQDARGRRLAGRRRRAAHDAQRRHRPPGPHQRQRRVDRLRVRRRPVGRQHAATAPPRKLAIEVNADDKSNTETHRHLHQRRHRVRPLAGREARGLRRPRRAVPDDAARRRQGHAADRHPGLRPRRRLVARTARRSSSSPTATAYEDLYLLEPDDPEHPELTKAHKFKVDAADQHAARRRSAPASAPKGKRIAFLRGGKLWTMKPDGTDQKVLVERRAGVRLRLVAGRQVTSSTPGWTARSPASCTSSATDGSGPPGTSPATRPTTAA